MLHINKEESDDIDCSNEENKNDGNDLLIDERETDDSICGSVTNVKCTESGSQIENENFSNDLKIDVMPLESHLQETISDHDLDPDVEESTGSDSAPERNSVAFSKSSSRGLPNDISKTVKKEMKHKERKKKVRSACHSMINPKKQKSARRSTLEGCKLHPVWDF